MSEVEGRKVLTCKYHPTPSHTFKPVTVSVSLFPTFVVTEAFLQHKMGNILSSTAKPSDCPASPAILFSLSIVPPTIVFYKNQRPTNAQIVITLTNTTTRPITFRHVSTPLQVSSCFTYGRYLEPWAVIDLTEDRVIQIVTEDPPCRYDMVPTDPSSLKYEAHVFTTVPPGAKNSVTLSFDMNILAGLTAGHNYAIKLSDFETEAYWWG